MEGQKEKSERHNRLKRVQNFPVYSQTRNMFSEVTSSLFILVTLLPCFSLLFPLSPLPAHTQTGAKKRGRGGFLFLLSFFPPYLYWLWLPVWGWKIGDSRREEGGGILDLSPVIPTATTQRHRQCYQPVCNGSRRGKISCNISYGLMEWKRKRYATLIRSSW